MTKTEEPPKKRKRGRPRKERTLQEEIRETPASDKLNYLRSVATDSMIQYVGLCDGTYQDSRIHRFIAKVLELTEKRKLKRVAISIPPRHGKSRLVSVEFPSWVLGRNPKSEVIVASYGAELAETASLQVRDRISTSDQYKKIFPETQLHPQSKKLAAWNTSSGGQFIAAGVGGPITGKGADYLIIDDPFKNREEAESPTQREKVWDWFTSTAYTRLSPEGVVVIIMTRWHDDDLVGRLTDDEHNKELEENGLADEKFVVFNFPAICEENGDKIGRNKGDPLWPERWTPDRLKGIEKTVGSYDWASLYQGRPRPKGGMYINREWFNLVSEDEAPKVKRWKRFWDLATTTKNYSDFTCGIKAGITDRDELVLMGMEIGKWKWPEAKRRIKFRALIESIIVGVEANGNAVGLFDDLKDELSGKVVVKNYSMDSDKLTRALPWIAKAEANKVILVRGDWVYDFMDQCESFPTGTHDDMVDAVSGVYEMLTSSTVPVLV